MRTHPEDIAALVERLEAAKEGSEELDVAIQRTLCGFTEDMWYCLKYTTSLDAALTLVPEGWAYRIQRNLNGGCFAELQGPEMPQLSHTGDYPTAPLALCIAALRARSAS